MQTNRITNQQKRYKICLSLFWLLACLVACLFGSFQTNAHKKEDDFSELFFFAFYFHFNTAKQREQLNDLTEIRLTTLSLTKQNKNKQKWQQQQQKQTSMNFVLHRYTFIQASTWSFFVSLFFFPHYFLINHVFKWGQGQRSPGFWIKAVSATVCDALNTVKTEAVLFGTAQYKPVFDK